MTRRFRDLRVGSEVGTPPPGVRWRDNSARGKGTCWEANIKWGGKKWHLYSGPDFALACQVRHLTEHKIRWDSPSAIALWLLVGRKRFIEGCGE